MLDWVDGRPAAELSVRDRGLAYGDGLFVEAGVVVQPLVEEA